MMANLRPMYDDLMAAIEGADVLISGEIVYAAPSVVEKTGINWITTSLAPISMFSAYDPAFFRTPNGFNICAFSVLDFIKHYFTRFAER